MKMILLNLGRLSAAFMVFGFLQTQLPGQTEKDEYETDNPFNSLSAKLLRIKYDGENFVYAKRVLVGKDGREPVVIKRTITEEYAVSVPFIVNIDGKSIRKKRKEVRTREIEVTKVLQGEYKTETTVVDKAIKFYGLDGDELDRNAIIKKMGMNSAPVLILREGQSVPPIWKSVMMENVMIVYSNKLLDESFKNIR